MSKIVKIVLLALSAFLSFSFSIAAIAASLELGSSFKSVNPDCTARSDGTKECEEYIVASESLPAWIHTLSVTAGYDEPGDGVCEVWAGLNDPDAGVAGKETLIQVYATAAVPANVAITLPTPIKMNALDEVFVRGIVKGDGDCRAEAYFGVRVPPDEE